MSKPDLKHNDAPLPRQARSLSHVEQRKPPQKHESGAPALQEEALKRWRQALAAQKAEIQGLLRNIKARLPELMALLEKVSSHWHGEDGFYRFYHQSSTRGRCWNSSCAMGGSWSNRLK